MKWILLLTFVAFGYARLSPKPDDTGDNGTINIKGGNGKDVAISKTVDKTGNTIIVFFNEDQNVSIKQIHISKLNDDKLQNITTESDENTEEQNGDNDSSEEISTKSKTPADLLRSIFEKYEEVVDEKSYESLLKEVNEYVDSGKLDSSILNVLKTLNDQKMVRGKTDTQSVPDSARVPLYRPENYNLNRYQLPQLNENDVTEQR